MQGIFTCGKYVPFTRDRLWHIKWLEVNLKTFKWESLYGTRYCCSVWWWGGSYLGPLIVRECYRRESMVDYGPQYCVQTWIVRSWIYMDLLSNNMVNFMHFKKEISHFGLGISAFFWDTAGFIFVNLPRIRGDLVEDVVHLLTLV